jgi:hypothetical protein
MGIDVGYGSSAFAIVIVEVINGELNITYSDEWPRLDFNESIAKAEKLMLEYNIDRKHGSPVFVDASNPSFIRSLKAGKTRRGCRLCVYDRGR